MNNNYCRVWTADCILLGDELAVRKAGKKAPLATAAYWLETRPFIPFAIAPFAPFAAVDWLDVCDGGDAFVDWAYPGWDCVCCCCDWDCDCCDCCCCCACCWVWETPFDDVCVRWLLILLADVAVDGVEFAATDVAPLEYWPNWFPPPPANSWSERRLEK